MSDALGKTIAALQRLGLDPTLIDVLSSRRIAVVSGPNSDTVAGRLLAEALGDTLGRLWGSLDASGPLAAVFVTAANGAARSGGQSAPASEGWSPPYAFVIAIGSSMPEATSAGIRVGADGWKAVVGPSAKVSEDPNPVGPVAAALLSAAEVFRSVFREQLGDRARFLPPEYEWSAWDFGQGNPGPDPMALFFRRPALIGVGAVLHGSLWLLERWPALVSGEVDLVDPDPYDESNGQRYAGMAAGDVGVAKSVRAAERLRERHPGLTVTPFQVHGGDYFETERSGGCPLVVIGVDSRTERRHIGLKLPRRAVNMWTDAEMLGSARHGLGDGWPCLYCSYPEDQSGAPDEVVQISADTNIPPARVRELLNTNVALSDMDIQGILGRFPGIDPAPLRGLPMRSVRAHLCAVGSIPVIPGGSDVDVPLGFVSFLAGLTGFVELVRELTAGDVVPTAWQMGGFGYPLPGHRREVAPTPDCYLCVDQLALDLVAERYGHA